MDFDEQITEDFIFDGRLVVHQRRRGYRFSVDAPLLIWFASQNGRTSDCLDIGAGSGIVGLGLLATRAVERVTAIEIQDSLHKLSVFNADANNLQEHYEPISGDLANSSRLLDGRNFDLIVSNPPYWPADNGRLPRDPERRIAGHEIHGTIETWTGQMAGLLKNRKSRVMMIFPARRFDQLLVGLGKAGLAATRIIPVHPTARSGAELVLVEASAAATGHIRWDPPLVLKEPDGCDTATASQILSGSFNAALASLPDRRGGQKHTESHSNSCGLSAGTID